MLPELSPTLIRRRLTFLFPEELIEGIARWSVAQPVLLDLGLALGHPPSNIPEQMRREARQPEKSRLTLNKRVAQAFNSGIWP